jgi:cytochrome b561
MNSVPRYNGTAMLLHWLMAVVIAAVSVVGLLFDDMSRDVKPFWLNLHAVFGTTILALVAVRLVWRWYRPPPPYPMPKLAKALSDLAHGALYGLMGFVPLLGLLALFARGRGIDFWLFTLPSPLERNRDLGRAMLSGHSFLAYVLFAIAGLHIVAALYHQFILGDGLLARMLPRREIAGSSSV